MKLALFVLFAALSLAGVAGQNTVLQNTRANTSTSAITACAVQGGSCSQPSLDGSPFVLEHSILAGGCAQADLHVVRYVPADSPDGIPVVASWCS